MLLKNLARVFILEMPSANTPEILFINELQNCNRMYLSNAGWGEFAYGKSPDRLTASWHRICLWGKQSYAATVIAG